MALQGTIESFAIADVLRLLGTSAKTGRLILNGDRGTASVWVQAGELVGGGTAQRPHNDDIVDVVFELLRFDHGSFIFEGDAECPSPSQPMPIGPVLEQAEAALSEWHDIVSVVPGLSAWVNLRAELPHPEVVVDQACWTSIVAVGSGATVGEVAEALGLGELPVCRLVRALVAAGFVEVSQEAPLVDDGGVGFDPLAGLPELPLRRPSVESVAPEYQDDSFATGGHDPDEVALPSLRISGLVDDPFDSSVTAEVSGAPLEDQRWESPTPATEEDPADLARSMAMLSPKAAEALAAAVSGDGEEPPDDDDNRERMLRFLGSV